MLATTQLEAQRQEAARVAAAEQAAQRQEEARQQAARAETARQETQRQEAARAAAIARQSQREEMERQEAARVDAARKEVERQETARVEAERKEAQRQDAARVAAAEREAQRQEAERQEAARAAATRAEAERQAAARPSTPAPASGPAASAPVASAAPASAAPARSQAAEDEEKREARLRAIGRQLDEEATRRNQAADPRRPALPYSVGSARRIRLWGRADTNAELIRYAEAWEQKIQLNTPAETVRQVSRQPHTHPMVTVAIRSDGSVESVTFAPSSGAPEVDEAIRRIVRSLEHYPAFPPALARDYDVIEIRRTWHFDSGVRLY